jgi:hypothetical protein
MSSSIINNEPINHHTRPSAGQPHTPPEHVFEGPQVCPLQLLSAQSICPSQSLSWPSLQVDSVAWAVPPFPEQTQLDPEQRRPFAPHVSPLQLLSAQSVCPSQSLSWPSSQVDSVAWTAPPFPVQTQLVPEQMRPLGPQERPLQLASAQSVCPSQSLSTESLQVDSAGGVWAPKHTHTPEALQVRPLVQAWQDSPPVPQLEVA